MTKGICQNGRCPLFFFFRALIKRSKQSDKLIHLLGAGHK